jgi:hypothetical protein
MSARLVPIPGLRPDVSKVGRVDALLLSHTHAVRAGDPRVRRAGRTLNENR